MEIILLLAVAFFVIGGIYASCAPRIAYELQQIDEQQIQGQATSVDFSNVKSLKRAVSHLLNNYECPQCHTHQVQGDGVIVIYGKVRLYRQQAVTGWFGRVKHKDVHYQTVWRIHEMRLRSAPGRALLNFFGVFEPNPGKLECHAQGCHWEESGERGGTLSLRDLFQGVS